MAGQSPAQRLAPLSLLLFYHAQEGLQKRSAPERPRLHGSKIGETGRMRRRRPGPDRAVGRNGPR